ncbi:MAG: P-loop NTPase [Candidatus Aureabacteria bacterium]|nr:P-loop NTPase [Candidatus Auribacterota bacterium]
MDKAHIKASSDIEKIESYQYQLIEKKFSFLLESYSNTAEHEQAVYKINSLMKQGVTEDEIFSSFTGFRFPLPHCIAFASGKGGVGKSMLATNTAVYYANTGKKVLLFDADYGLSNANIYLNFRTEKSLLDFFLSGDPEDALEIIRPNLHYVHTGSGDLKLTDLKEHEFIRIRKMLLTLAGKYDVIILDCSPGIGRGIIQTLSMGARTVLVTSTQSSAITDTYALLKVLCQTIINPHCGIVVNMARSINEAENAFQRISLCAKKFLKRDIDFLGIVPYSFKISQSLNNRKPIVSMYPTDIRSGKRIIDLAKKLFSSIENEKMQRSK